MHQHPYLSDSEFETLRTTEMWHNCSPPLSITVWSQLVAKFPACKATEEITMKSSVATLLQVVNYTAHDQSNIDESQLVHAGVHCICLSWLLHS